MDCNSRDLPESILPNLFILANAMSKSFKRSSLLLPPANQFARVMFLQVPVCPRGGGVYPSMHGGVPRGVSARGCVCLGVCPGRCVPGGPEADTPQMLRDTVNKRAARVVSECILVPVGITWVINPIDSQTVENLPRLASKIVV